MKKNIKAFTLVELLAVIIILGIIVLIATPIVNDVISNSKQRAYDFELETILKQSLTYSVQENLGQSADVKALQFQDLINAGLLQSFPTNHLTGGNLEGCVLYNWDTSINQYVFNYSETCEIPIVIYKDTTLNGADPVLTNGLIPVTIASNGDVTIVDTTEKWYNYEEKTWANAITLMPGETVSVGDVLEDNSSKISAYYVWIPRYEYKIFDTDTDDSDLEQLIDIRFVSNTEPKETTPTLNEYYTHPAFTFGDTEVNGIWAGKFEMTGTEVTPTILPNSDSLVSLNISQFFNSIIDMDTDYQVSNADTHMLKNMEWGAMAYLSHSRYGIGEEVRINNQSSHTTGCGALTANASSSSTCSLQYGTQTDNNYPQSTTGNISGIFDTSGGTYEYVMGYQNQNHTANSGFPSNFFTDTNNLKYFDTYSYGTSSSDYTRGMYGDATKEVTWWYGDYSIFVYSVGSWFVRGGNSSSTSTTGVFSFYIFNGNAYGFNGSRAALIAF